MTRTAFPTLARLVGDTDEFFDAHFDREPHFNGGTDLATLASLADFDALLESGWLAAPTMCAMYRNGIPIDRDRYTQGPTRVEPEEFDRDGGGLVVPDAVLELFDAGASVRLRRAEMQVPRVRELCAGLGRELGHGVRANTYITPPNSVGLTPHYDGRDVFVVQTEGSKRWELTSPEIPMPLLMFNPANRRQDRGPDVVFTLTPGDILYVPRGWTHTVTSLGQTSMHLTLAVRRTVHYHVAMELLERLIERPSIRGGLPVGYDPGETAESELEFIRAEINALLDEVGADGVERILTQLRDSTLDGGPKTRFTERAGAAGNELVALDPSVVVEAVQPDLRVVMGGRVVDVPDLLAPGFELLAAGEHVALDDLADESVDPVLSRTLGERLVAAGVLRVAGAA